MNLVGKIFTVLIFLMCVVFGTFALMVHSAHKNWKTEAYDYNRQLTEANQQKQEALEEQKNLQTALADEKARIQKRLIALENQAKIAIAQRDAMESKLRVEEDDARKLALAIEAANKNLGVLQDANRRHAERKSKSPSTNAISSRRNSSTPTTICKTRSSKGRSWKSCSGNWPRRSSS